MNENLREVIYKYVAEYLGRGLKPIDTYSDENLKELITEDEHRMLTIISTGRIKKNKVSKNAVLKDHVFHVSFTRSNIVVKAEDAQQAKEIFQDMTLEEVGVDYKNFKIMNL